MPFSPASSSSPPLSPMEKRIPRYSFNWAYEKVDLAIRTHPRGWEIFMPVLGLSTRQLAFLLACNAPEWAVIRSIVHQVDKWLDQQDRVGPDIGRGGLTTTHMLSSLKTLVCRIELPELKRYLTGRISQFILQEQVKKGLPPSGGSGLFSEEELDACQSSHFECGASQSELHYPTEESPRERQGA